MVLARVGLLHPQAPVFQPAPPVGDSQVVGMFFGGMAYYLARTWRVTALVNLEKAYTGTLQPVDKDGIAKASFVNLTIAVLESY